MVALSEVAVGIVASGDEARFRDLMEAHHYLGALPGNLGPKALQRFRVRRRDGQYRAPSLSATVGRDRTVALDSEPVGRAKTHALDGRRLAAIAPGVIPPGHFFLHADHADSHDSRYAEIGLVPAARILGRAIAMPDIPWLGLDGPLVGPEEVRQDDSPEAVR